MQRISIRLLVAFVTFCVGVVIAAVWVARQVPQLDMPSLSESSQPELASRCFPGRSQNIDVLRRAKGGYFPEGAFSQYGDLGNHVLGWYTDTLKQLNEPTLLNSERTAYRFLWLRSFHSTIAVRLWLDGERKMLSVKELGRDNAHDSTLAVNQTRSLTPEEWATFTRLLNASCFWEMSSSSNGPIANDGAWWIFEGVQEGQYHVTHRQSPDSGSYRELCLYMLKLSGLPLDESKGEIY